MKAIIAVCLLLVVGTEADVQTFAESIVSELLTTEKGRLPCSSLTYTTSHKQLLPLLWGGNGSIVEMGVFAARTTNLMAERYPNHTVHGFDSFEGLPEEWDQGDIKNPAGTFHISILNTTRSGRTYLKGSLPKIRDNVKLHIGWFNDTLPPFAKDLRQPIGLLHIDSDLYSSANLTFGALSKFLIPGSVIVFDEFFGYPRYLEHEIKAFYEFIQSRDDLSFEIIGTHGYWSRGICVTIKPERTYPDHCQSIAIRLVSNDSVDHIKLSDEGLVTSKNVPLVSSFCHGHKRDSYSHEHHIETEVRLTRLEEELKNPSKAEPSTASVDDHHLDQSGLETRLRDVQQSVDQLYERLKQLQQKDEKRQRLANNLANSKAASPSTGTQSSSQSFPSFDHIMEGFVLTAVVYGLFIFSKRMLRTHFNIARE